MSSEVNNAQKKDDANINFSLTTVCYSNLLNWIMDVCATYHVCPEKGWFASFEKLDSGVVLMGNDHAYWSLGIGTIRIKMHNRVIQELCVVYYVCALKKNLSSIGSLEW